MIHEIHLTHSLLVREQHYTPESDLEKKGKYLMQFFVSVLLNGWPAWLCLNEDCRLVPGGVIFFLSTHAHRPGSVGCYPLGRAGLDDPLLRSSQQI